MQGKIILSAILFAGLTPAAIAGEPIKRPTCKKADQAQQPQRRQQQAQQQREKSQECRIPRNIPPVVDPTPSFLL